MLQTTNKKTNEVFNIIEMEERNVVLQNVVTTELKNTTQSTLKRWYTKPVEIVVVNTPVEKATQDNSLVQQLKDQLLNYLLTDQMFTQQLCNDGTISVKYNNKTITQIKGKKKVRVFFNTKHISNNVLTDQMFVENVKYTHDSYVKLENEQHLQLITECIEQVKQSVTK